MASHTSHTYDNLPGAAQFDDRTVSATAYPRPTAARGGEDAPQRDSGAQHVVRASRDVTEVNHTISASAETGNAWQDQGLAGIDKVAGDTFSKQQLGIPTRMSVATSVRASHLAQALPEILKKRKRMQDQLAALIGSRSSFESYLSDFNNSSDAAIRPAVFSEQPFTDTIRAAYDSSHAATEQPAYGIDPAQFTAATAVHGQVRRPEEGLRLQTESLAATLLQLSRSRQAIQQQEEEATASLVSLSNLEAHWTKELEQLSIDLRQLEDYLEVDDQLFVTAHMSKGKAERNQPASAVPSIVERYFDRAGDIGIWEERAVDLEEEMAEGQMQRDLIADRGDELDASETEFYENFRRRREHIQREMQIAIDQAENLAHECQKQGYDPERYRIARRSDTDSMLYFPDRESLSPSPVSDVMREPAWSRRETHLPSGKPAERVTAWLRTDPPDDGDPFDYGPIGLGQPMDVRAARDESIQEDLMASLQDNSLHEDGALLDELATDMPVSEKEPLQDQMATGSLTYIQSGQRTSTQDQGAQQSPPQELLVELGPYSGLPAQSCSKFDVQDDKKVGQIGIQGHATESQGTYGPLRKERLTDDMRMKTRPAELVMTMDKPTNDKPEDIQPPQDSFASNANVSRSTSVVASQLSNEILPPIARATKPIPQDVSSQTSAKTNGSLLSRFMRLRGMGLKSTSASRHEADR